jgi:hypothetical protein
VASVRKVNITAAATKAVAMPIYREGLAKFWQTCWGSAAAVAVRTPMLMGQKITTTTKL